MNLIQAINDPERPLSMSPNKWIKEAKTRRGSLVASEPIIKETIEPIIELENSIDGMIVNLKQFYDVYNDNVFTDKEQLILTKIKDLFDTAITPYLSDIVEEIDKLED